MIKRTVYIGNPAYLSLRLGQLCLQGVHDADGVVPEPVTIPVEDLGVLVLDHGQITLTHGLLQAMLEANVAVLSCDGRHHPSGQLLPLCGNVLQHERYQAQLGASAPLRKQLWGQVVQAKLKGQARVLKELALAPTAPLLRWATETTSGDPKNMEARGAAYYWRHMLAAHADCTRDRDGAWPNPAYNYAYAIVRATVARGLVGAGLLPTVGIHHHNRYNAFCLADDMMEPLRPVADLVVQRSLARLGTPEDFGLSKPWKAALLALPAVDVRIEGERSPMMVATQRMAISLYKCFAGQSRRLALPEILGE